MGEETTDDQYKRATKAVDDAMRIDVLGPKVVEIIKKYTPAQTSLKEVFNNSIKTEQPTQDGIKDIVDTRLDERKIKGMSKFAWIILGAAVGMALTLAGGLMLHQFTKEDKPSTNTEQQG